MSNFHEHCLDVFSLTKAECEGKRRQEVNEKKKLTGRNSGAAAGPRALEMHILGAKGELAVAQYLGLEPCVFQDLVPSRGSYDIPPNIDVKTRSQHWMDLVVQIDDSSNKVFVHATCVDSNVQMHGWAYGYEIMQPKYKKDPARGRPAYFVPFSALRPMPLLQDIILDLRLL
jgi:hypothetical protein